MLHNIFYDHWQHSWPAAWQAERFTKNLANGILYFSFLSTRHTIMAERTYLPLILFSAILSALCTFARNMIDYQQIVQCRQAQKASALRLHPSAPGLHPSAPICTATIPHTPHDMNSSASRTLRHRGSGFSVRATDFSTSLHIFFWLAQMIWHPRHKHERRGQCRQNSPLSTLLFTLIIRALQDISAECRQFCKKPLHKDCLHHLHWHNCTWQQNIFSVITIFGTPLA